MHSSVLFKYSLPNTRTRGLNALLPSWPFKSQELSCLPTSSDCTQHVVHLYLFSKYNFQFLPPLASKCSRVDPFDSKISRPRLPWAIHQVCDRTPTVTQLEALCDLHNRLYNMGVAMLSSLFFWIVCESQIGYKYYIKSWTASDDENQDHNRDNV